MLRFLAQVFSYLVVVQCVGSYGSVLSNFQLEKLRIKTDKTSPHYGHVLNETVHLLQNHYIYRSAFNAADWKRLREEAAVSHSNPHDAVRDVMGRIHDRYGRFIEPSLMRTKSDNLRGVSVGLGMRLRRTWLFPDFKTAVKHSLFPNVNRDFRYYLHQAVFVGSIGAAIISAASPLTGASISWPRRLISFVPAAAVLVDRLLPVIRPLEVCDITNQAVGDAGIAVGDKLLYLDGQRVPCLGSSGRLLRRWSRSRVGDTVPVTVLRYPSSTAQDRIDRNGSKISYSNVPQEHSFSLVCDYVPHDTVSARLLNTESGRSTAYIAISEFSDETFSEFVFAWERLKKQFLDIQAAHSEHRTQLMSETATPSEKSCFVPSAGSLKTLALHQQHEGKGINGLVIDLRGNPGGTLVPALDIAALFLPRGTVLTCLASDLPLPSSSVHSSSKGSNVSHFRNGGKLERFYSSNRAADRSTSLLVLTDDCTASASEILVEALVDNGRAVSCAPAASDYFGWDNNSGQKGGAPLPAMRTVGKHLAQAVLALSDGSGLFFSVREFFTPSGRTMSEGHQPRLTTQQLGLGTGGSLLGGNPSDSLDRLYWDSEKQLWTT